MLSVLVFIPLFLESHRRKSKSRFFIFLYLLFTLLVTCAELKLRVVIEISIGLESVMESSEARKGLIDHNE